MFEGKERAEIALEMCAMVSKNQTESQFNALASLDADTRQFVVDTLEEKFYELADKFVEMIETEGFMAAKKRFISIHAPNKNEAINEEQALTELAKQLASLKGEAAHPLLKTFAQDVSALSKEQTETENTVYGALFDAIEKTMGPELEEKQRLMKINESFGWRVTVGVKEHFNNAGKYQQFAEAPTEEEKAEQKKALRGLLMKSEPEAALASLTATDVFMRVARRVGTDAELATLVKGDFDEKDVEVLEKNKLTSLAALVKTAMANKPK